MKNENCKMENAKWEMACFAKTRCVERVIHDQ